MAYHDGMVRPLPRLYTPIPLAEGVQVALERAQAHYVKDVMRLSAGDRVRIFNGADGEWQSEITEAGRNSAMLTTVNQTRPQPAFAGPRLIFAPLKKNATDFVVAKATELGAARISPMITEFTDTTRVNRERLTANTIEAAEQCERLDVPVVDDARRLADILADWNGGTPLICADETGGGAPILDALHGLKIEPGASRETPAFVIGPQGGFSKSELVSFDGLAFATKVDLGPRILRAETAVAAVLTCWQAARGDWRNGGTGS